jgi:hypothetical protein
MGPKNSKSRLKVTKTLSFEQKLAYFTGIEELLPIRFLNPMMNLELVPREILQVIFSKVVELSFLGKIARVCQLVVQYEHCGCAMGFLSWRTRTN